MFQALCWERRLKKLTFTVYKNVIFKKLKIKQMYIKHGILLQKNTTEKLKLVNYMEQPCNGNTFYALHTGIGQGGQQRLTSNPYSICQTTNPTLVQVSSVQRKYIFLLTQVHSAHLRGCFSAEEVPLASSHKGTQQASGFNTTMYETQEHYMR